MLHGHVSGSWTLQVLLIPAVMFISYFRLSVQKYWSLTLREERKVRVFENMVLRRIFVPRRDEVRGKGGMVEIA